MLEVDIPGHEISPCAVKAFPALPEKSETLHKPWSVCLIAVLVFTDSIKSEYMLNVRWIQKTRNCLCPFLGKRAHL
jgi:hypothetical protein